MNIQAENNSYEITPIQKQFLLAVVRAMVAKQSAVSTIEIQRMHGRSESCVRNHVIRMEDRGHMVLVGKTDHRQMFATTREGMDVIDEELVQQAEKEQNPLFDIVRTQNLFCIGGYCQVSGCDRAAEDFYRNGFYCRNHIMGCSPEEDMINLHRDHEALWDTKSVAGDVSDLVIPDVSYPGDNSWME